MQIDKQVIDEVNVVLKMTLEKADYQERVDQKLKEYRKKANIPGFRPGYVPASLIKKRFGKAILVEEIEQLVSESLYQYLRDNEVKLLGDPLPSQSQPELDFDNQETFEFDFDIALSPELASSIGKEDVIPYYTIRITDEMVENQIKNLTAGYGTYVPAESSEERDLIKGTLTELLPEGSEIAPLTVTDAVLMPAYLKDPDEKAKMIGLKVGDVVVFNPSKAYAGAASEIASLLKISNQDAAQLTSDFRLEVSEITRYQEPALDQALFDRIYGEGVVNSEEAFRERVTNSLREQYATESDYRFLFDAQKLLMKKVGEVKFPEETLKRWLLSTQKEATPESVEAEMPGLIEDLKWQLIKEQLIKDNNLTVSDESLMEAAKQYVKDQFVRYGMSHIPEDLLTNYASDLLKKDYSRKRILDQAVNRLLIDFLKGAVKLKEKEISLEEFNRLYEKEKGE
jgi:trigger factor